MQKQQNLQMLKRLTAIVIITTFALTSCVTTKHIFINEIFSDFSQLKINKAVTFEKRNKSKDFTPAYSISIGEGIYPNRNNYKLETPRIFATKLTNEKFTLV